MNNISSIDDFISGKKRIIYAILNWGLGHATRSIPIIEYLLHKNIKLTIVTDGLALSYLKDRYNDLEIVNLPGYNINYKSNSLFINSIFQGPKIIAGIFREKNFINNILKGTDYDCIISDCRFGIRHNAIPSYIITHQLNIPIKNKTLQWLINKINSRLISKFDAIWIPDYSNSLLSGNLSKPKHNNTSFLGPLSRFQKSTNKSQAKYKVAVILSGPEPQRTDLEQELLKILPHISKKSIFVRGVPISEKKLDHHKNIDIINLAHENELWNIFETSEWIICRSGYSSIMDLHVLNKKAILIPTPNQPEQEYLATHLNNNIQFKILYQNKISRSEFSQLLGV